MEHVEKPIRLSSHARTRLSFRGVTEEEVIDAIRTSEWAMASQGRRECRRNLSFESTWQGKTYATKQVRPIFVVGSSEIVVVTVYVYYL